MDIQITQILLQAANFALVMFVLVKFLFKPVTKMLENRSKKVEEGLVAAEKNIAQQKKLEEQVEEQLKEARQQARTITSEAKAEAEAEAREIVDKAKEEAREIVAKERMQLDNLLQEQRKKAQKELADLVSDAVASILKDELSAAHQEEIVKNQTKKLASMKLS